MSDETQGTWKQTLAKICIPQRYVLGIMGFLAVANAYAMRGCLSLAITEMVVNPKTKHTHHIEDPNGCPGVLEVKNHTDPNNEFDWDEQTQGYILSAFYWGYVLTHIPGGLLAQRFGGKQTLGLGILGTSVLTLVTPFAARAGANWMIAVRLLEGLGEGTTFPALNQLLAQWVPPLERGRLGSLVFAGNQIGVVVSSALSGVLLEYYDWPVIFYLFGFLGVIWYVVWCFVGYNDPASHPFITESEKDYLAETLGSIKRKEHLRVPWGAMATSLPLWGLIVGQIGHDWGLFTIQTDLPKYMKSVMKFSIVQNGMLNSLPFLVMWFTAIASGILSDFLLKKKVWTISVARKAFTTVASVGPALGVILASYAGCDRVAAATLFAVGMAFMGFFLPFVESERPGFIAQLRRNAYGSRQRNWSHFGDYYARANWLPHPQSNYDGVATGILGVVLRHYLH